MMSSEPWDEAAEFEAALTNARAGRFVTDTGLSPDVQGALIAIADRWPIITDDDIAAARTIFESERLA